MSTTTPQQSPEEIQPFGNENKSAVQKVVEYCMRFAKVEHQSSEDFITFPLEELYTIAQFAQTIFGSCGWVKVEKPEDIPEGDNILIEYVSYNNEVKSTRASQINIRNTFDAYSGYQWFELRYLLEQPPLPEAKEDVKQIAVEFNKWVITPECFSQLHPPTKGHTFDYWYTNIYSPQNK